MNTVQVNTVQGRAARRSLRSISSNRAQPMGTRPTLSIRDISRIAVFAAILAVLGIPGAIPVFGGAVPITAQTLGVMLAGAILGSWRGAAAVAVFEILVLVGLPLLSGGRGGIAVFAGPSVGYLLGWIIGAFVIGLIARPGDLTPRWWRTALGCFTGGIVVVYALGIPLQSLITGLPLAQTTLSSAVFLPGDILKVVVATIVTLALWKAYPRAFERTTSVPPELRLAAHDETAGSSEPVQTEQTRGARTE